MNPQDFRRAVRTWIFAILAIAGLILIAALVWRGKVDALIAIGLLFANLLAVGGYIAENVTQRMRFKFGPTGGEADFGNNQEPEA